MLSFVYVQVSSKPIPVQGKYVCSLDCNKDGVVAGFSNGTVSYYAGNGNLLSALEEKERFIHTSLLNVYTTPTPMAEDLPKTSHVNCVSLSKVDSFFYSTENSTLHLWDLQNSDEPTLSMKTSDGQITAISQSADGITTFGTSLGQVNIFDPRVRGIVLASDLDLRTNNHVSALSWNTFIPYWTAVGDEGSNLHIIDWRFPDNPMLTISGFISPVTTAQFLPTHANLVLSGTTTGVCRFINVGSGDYSVMDSFAAGASIAAAGFPESKIDSSYLITDTGELYVRQYEKGYFANFIDSAFTAEEDKDERDLELSVFTRELDGTFEEITELAQRDINDRAPDKALQLLALCYQQDLHAAFDWGSIEDSSKPYAGMSRAQQYDVFARELGLYSKHLPPGYHELYGKALSTEVKKRITALSTAASIYNDIKNGDYDSIAAKRDMVFDHVTKSDVLKKPFIVADLIKLVVECDFPYSIDTWVLPLVKAFQEQNNFDVCLPGLIYPFYPTIFDDIPESFIPSYDASLITPSHDDTFFMNEVTNVAPKSVLPAGLTNLLPSALTSIPSGITHFLPSAITSLPGALTSLPGALTSLPGALTSLPGALTSLPGALTSLPSGIASLVPVPNIFDRGHRRAGSTSHEKRKNALLKEKLENYDAVVKQLTFLFNVMCVVYGSDRHSEKLKKTFKLIISFFKENDGIYAYSVVRLALNHVEYQSDYLALFEGFSTILPIVQKYPSYAHFDSLLKYYVSRFVEKTNKVDFAKPERAVPIIVSFLKLCYNKNNVCPKQLLPLFPQLAQKFSARLGDYVKQVDVAKFTEQQKDAYRVLLPLVKKLETHAVVIEAAAKSAKAFIAAYKAFIARLNGVQHQASKKASRKSSEPSENGTDAPEPQTGLPRSNSRGAKLSAKAQNVSSGSSDGSAEKVSAQSEKAVSGKEAGGKKPLRKSSSSQKASGSAKTAEEQTATERNKGVAEKGGQSSLRVSSEKRAAEKSKSPDSLKKTRSTLKKSTVTDTKKSKSQKASEKKE